MGDVDGGEDFVSQASSCKNVRTIEPIGRSGDVHFSAYCRVKTLDVPTRLTVCDLLVLWLVVSAIVTSLSPADVLRSKPVIDLRTQVLS